VPPRAVAAMTLTGTKTATTGASVLRLTRFQSQALLMVVVSPTQSAAAAKVTVEATEALE